MISRIGVLGGMFDPVHNGHIQAAKHVSESLSLDLVKFIPCSIPNHRASTFAAAKHRLAMIKLAIGDQARLEVDPIELERAGTSYTVDTMRALLNQTSSTEYVFILGVDAFNALTSWHEWEGLFDLCCLFVLARANFVINEDIAKATNLRERRVSSPDALFDSKGSIFFANNFKYDLSSTEIRNKVSSGADLREGLNDNVISYIHNNHLYNLDGVDRPFEK